MSSVRIEFLVEPFAEGNPGPHVQAGIDAARRHGIDAEVGPFGTSLVVREEDAGAVVGDVIHATLSHGATRVAMQVDRVDG